MKKLIILILCALIGYTNAQEIEQDSIKTPEKIVTTSEIIVQRRNDIMVNPIALVLGIGSIAYEYHLNKDSGIGISTSFVFSKSSGVLEGNNWHVLPYYRYYFGKKWANGFFVDGFAGIVGLPITVWELRMVNGFYFDHYIEKNITNFGLGFGLGGKWRLKNNLLIEASTGIGSTFKEGFPIFAKGMLGLGYRF